MKEWVREIQQKFLNMGTGKFVNSSLKAIRMNTQNWSFKMQRKCIKIKSLPEDDCLLHGDFHSNNILITPDGTPVIIDFMNVCYGPSSYDIARTYFLIKQFDKDLADKYIKEIGVSETNIAEYLYIIEFCRKCEG